MREIPNVAYEATYVGDGAAHWLSNFCFETVTFMKTPKCKINAV